MLEIEPGGSLGGALGFTLGLLAAALLGPLGAMLIDVIRRLWGRPPRRPGG